MKRLLLFILFLVLYLLNSLNPNMMEQFFKFRHYYLLGTIARFLMSFSFILLPISLLYKNKNASSLLSIICLPATIISLFFIKDIVFHVRRDAWYYITIYVFLASYIIIYSLYCIYKTRFKVNLNGLKLGISTAILLIPLNLLMCLRHNKHFMYKIFQTWYFIFLVLFVAAAFILYYFLKKKDKDKKELILFILSLTLLYHLFCRFSFVRLHNYQGITDIVGALPLYVCSFGIMILPFSIYSKNEQFQTFSFLINTPGSIIVFVNPAIGLTSIFNYDVTYFIYSHLGLFAVAAMLPLCLKAKLNFKFVGVACLYMLLYFFIILFLDFGFYMIYNTEYNFSYVATPPLPVDIEIFGIIDIKGFKFSPVYIIILWSVHSLMSFVTYYFYRFVIFRKNPQI